MSMRELEQRHAQSRRRKQQKQTVPSANKGTVSGERGKRRASALDVPFAMLHPNQVLTFFEWCRLNRISERTGRRLLASGNGPTVTALSSNRIGVSMANNALWQQKRERA